MRVASGWITFCGLNGSNNLYTARGISFLFAFNKCSLKHAVKASSVIFETPQVFNSVVSVSKKTNVLISGMFTLRRLLWHW